jgi:hypothetical protein
VRAAVQRTKKSREDSNDRQTFMTQCAPGEARARRMKCRMRI